MVVNYIFSPGSRRVGYTEKLHAWNNQRILYMWKTLGGHLSRKYQRLGKGTLEIEWKLSNLWEDRPDLSWLTAVPGTSPPGQGPPHWTTSQNTDFPAFFQLTLSLYCIYQKESCFVKCRVECMFMGIEELWDEWKVVFAGCYWNQLGNRVGEGRRYSAEIPLPLHTEIHTPKSSYVRGIR